MGLTQLSNCENHQREIRLENFPATCQVAEDIGAATGWNLGPAGYIHWIQGKNMEKSKRRNLRFFPMKYGAFL